MSTTCGGTLAAIQAIDEWDGSEPIVIVLTPRSARVEVDSDQIQVRAWDRTITVITERTLL